MNLENEDEQMSAELIQRVVEAQEAYEEITRLFNDFAASLANEALNGGRRVDIENRATPIVEGLVRNVQQARIVAVERGHEVLEAFNRVLRITFNRPENLIVMSMQNHLNGVMTLTQLIENYIPLLDSMNMPPMGEGFQSAFEQVQDEVRELVDFATEYNERLSALLNAI